FSGARVIADDSGRYRIAIQSYQNRDEALAAMTLLRKQSRFSTVWVHSQP
ncbi:MAG: SPOR domain-containing protein, partial [Bacteroidales bacterium]|nr:SPOR domain-containing protein [Bacteroidales bacterium]